MRCIYLASLFFVLMSCNEMAADEAKTPTVPSLAATDQLLLSRCYQEVLMLKMMNEEANTRSAVAETRAMAQTAVTEHQDLLTRMETLAGKHAFQLPLDITEEQLRKWQTLVRSKGLNFDITYAETIQEEHAVAKKIFNDAASQATSIEIKNIALALVKKAEAHNREGASLQEILANRPVRDTAMLVDSSNDKTP